MKNLGRRLYAFHECQSKAHVSRLLSQTQSRKEGAENAKVWGRLFFNTEAQRHREFDVGGLKFVKPPPKSAPCLRLLQLLRACAAGLSALCGSARIKHLKTFAVFASPHLASFALKQASPCLCVKNRRAANPDNLVNPVKKTSPRPQVRRNVI